jgi:hypothetical protein
MGPTEHLLDSAHSTIWGVVSGGGVRIVNLTRVDFHLTR